MSEGVVTRVVVAAPEAAEREWVRSVLEVSGEYRVVAEAEDGLGAIDQVLQHAPEILVLDALMEGSEISGVETIPAVISRCPHTTIVMLAAPGSGAVLRVARRLGGAAWIARDQSTERILQTLRLASGMRLLGVPWNWRSRSLESPHLRGVSEDPVG